MSRWMLRISRDRVPVVIHDPTLDRTTNGTGFVREYTLAELKETRCRGGRADPDTRRGARP